MTLVDEWAREDLAALDARGLRRRLEPLQAGQGPRIRVDGREWLNFSSNDYLGLAGDLEVRHAAARALEAFGVGAGASRLVVGDTVLHQSLERTVADFEGVEAALVFSAGYAANVGALAALVGPGDVLFSDALNHASLIDGARLSRATVVKYPHGDVEALEALARRHPGRRRLVVTDTVFSMDGDRAPLRALAELCRLHELGLYVDEAHATGVLGPRGAGLCELEGVDADVRVGTLSKALGCFGAYVAGSSTLRELLLNKARSLVFSTGLPPAVCAAAEAAVTRVQTDSALRAQLWRHVRRVAQALRAKGVAAREDSAIFSIVLGSPERALAASAQLRTLGLVVKAIRPPTVPEGTSRLRVSLSAAHTDADIDRLLEGLEAVLAQAPVASAAVVEQEAR